MITKEKQTQITQQRLAALYQAITENGDAKSADKLLQIYEKLNNREFMISFTGHFSAGKSSMINHLLGKSILPKSPIPTSANVVKIKSGRGSARVYTDEGATFEYEEPYDIDIIKEYAKNKGNIKEIEISTKEAILPDGCTIIDTPGIDAADDADRLITESSLHLVDALFYVMDYNHVQSEVNLHFLKKAQDYGIPVYMIINQIDKHNEQELTFKNFVEKIKQTFDQWGIHPEIIYYSSLIEANAPHNQIDDIKMKLFYLLDTQSNDLFNIERSVNQVIDEHKDYLYQLYENEAAEMELRDGDDPADVLVRLDELHAEISRLNSIPDQMEKDFRNDLNTTLKNAYLMPAKLRDTVQLFLESQQSDFKVGLFGSKKKTEEERYKRVDDLLNGLQQNIEASVQWRLRDKLLNLLQEYGLYNQELTQKIQNISVSYDSGSLKALIKPGATVNGDYILRYTEDISHDVKQAYKQEALKLWESVHDEISRKIANESAAYESERDELEQIYMQQEKQETLKNELQQKIHKVDAAFADPEPELDTLKFMENNLAVKQVSITQAEFFPVLETSEPAIVEMTDQPAEKPAYPTRHIFSDLENTINTISGLPGFQSIMDDLNRKYDRLNNRSYTIALFGAFSAGKSSLANALIGEHVLPSAPNPTTAAINRIHPVSEQKRHGTVVVKMKDETTLVKDLTSLISHFSPKEGNLDELLEWITEHGIHQSDQLHKTHQAYLTAILNGYDYSRAAIGQEQTIRLDDFAAYVTDETIACYLESVDLYYDCSLTREGITLVDTPGADSINARHTNVAFDYIKYADAILYVTYYNHAFSRADKEFLMQLGRVKDAFHLDKMFFIMNASDLAEDTSELRMVQQYIEEHLTALGIRFPRLFPVSSKQSLEEKRHDKALNDQMKTFEVSFDHFIHHELASITIQSAIRDIHRAKQAVRQYLDSLQMNAAEKEQARIKLMEKQSSLKGLADEIDTGLYEQKISQKLEKQLYYVLERLSIRFHDLFKETFNPATITGSGKEAKQQLENSLWNLLDYTGYELLQELRAVSLRIESFIYDLKQEVYLEYTHKSSDIDNAFMPPDFEESELSTPDYEQAFINLDAQTFDKELKHFNGTKAFFVKNEKETMKESLFDRLYPFADAYIAENHKTMHTSYINQWNDMMNSMQQFIAGYAESYIDNQLRMISDQSVDIGTLRKKHEQLASILTEYEEMKAE
ncbi:MAG TPA: dynamin family protein [Lentibacillus sp.]|uniref:dynamin family protein n=1 Tax=Lentibacillus sp. TaxID=1925746 RepID=UPI002B4AF502|nr:dynamin family protein [Lentibacillus sp.]HLR63089.1 dynamin family protein [Lentibacillus sp.]